MDYKVISIPTYFSSLDIWETSYTKCNNDWELLTKRHSNTPLTSHRALLPEILSDSFKQFIVDSPRLCEYQKPWLLHSLSNRCVTDLDVSFLYLELTYPFQPNPLNQIISDLYMYNDSTFEEIFDILTYYMTYNNQPLLTENQVKEVQQSIEKNIKKSDSQDIAINELELWYTTQADKPEFFDTVSLYFNYSLYRIKYPINMTDTGNGIYVGESPRLMPDYFWLLMEEQLKKVTSSETPKLRIISLEEGLDTQLLNKVRHPNFKNNVYWPTHNAEQKNNDEFPYSIIFKESNNTFENLTDYSLNLDTETAHYSTTLTHISGWPDGSIPYDFLNYRQVISKTIFELAKDIRTSTQLTYIHCQSGLGRSGVFRIALEYALSKIDNEQPNSPFKLVEAFREKYRYAVQTANQFQYLHDLCDDIDQIYEKEEVFLKGKVS